jgi:hypothetical protein
VNKYQVPIDCRVKYNSIKSIKLSPAGLPALQGFLQKYFISGRLSRPAALHTKNHINLTYTAKTTMGIAPWALITQLPFSV